MREQARNKGNESSIEKKDLKQNMEEIDMEICRKNINTN